MPQIIENPDVEDADADDIPSFMNWNEASDTAPRSIGNCWSVEATGNPEIDAARGTALAIEAIAYSRRHGSPKAIVLALAEIGTLTRYTTVEIAFWDRIARSACAGALN